MENPLHRVLCGGGGVCNEHIDCNGAASAQLLFSPPRLYSLHPIEETDTCPPPILNTQFHAHKVLLPQIGDDESKGRF